MTEKIRVGSRESELAIAQAEIVMAKIKHANPDVIFELVLIRTTGDRNLDIDLDTLGGKGVFITELEQALVEDRIDIAVHSYKDMPFDVNDDLPVVALTEREAPFDVLVLPYAQTEFDNSLPVGSSSQRRSIQFNLMYPDYEVKPIRGNVLTRLAKLDLGEYSALILAQAGLIRLGCADRISRVFTLDEMVPAGSQGIIAVQARKGDNVSYLAAVHDWQSEVASLAERSYLRALGSSCESPVGVFAQIASEEILLTAMYVAPSGEIEIGKTTGKVDQAQYLGESLANELLMRVGA
ncbi:MAG: hydroxymethylbilane synthase [Coriobacteriia bacterium]|nr:hydroxymethylbilane synthase [Coriobacteriia bacterium]